MKDKTAKGSRGGEDRRSSGKNALGFKVEDTTGRGGECKVGLSLFSFLWHAIGVFANPELAEKARVRKSNNPTQKQRNLLPSTSVQQFTGNYLHNGAFAALLREIKGFRIIGLRVQLGWGGRVLMFCMP